MDAASAQLRELYQQHYFHETERRDQINNSLAIPLGIISIVSGAFVVVAKELDYPFDISEKFQIALLLLTAISITLAAFFLVRSYWGYGYGHMPRADELKKYHTELLDHYISTGKTKIDAESLAHDEVLEYIDSEYANNATKNAENNDKKSANLFKASGLTILSVGLLVFSAAPYVINSIIQPSEVQKIELINLKDLKMNNVNPPIPTGQGQQPPTPPSKPSPPPSRLVREHVEPPTKK